MSIPGAASPLFIGAAAEEAAFQIDRSLRFNSADSAYLSRTPSSAGNRKTWTWSGWVKRSALSGSGYPTLFNAGSASTSEGSIRFNPDDTIEFYDYNLGYNARLNTNRVFRDFSAWYHIVAVFDTTKATADERLRIYINGVEDSGTNRINPSQNLDGFVNNNIAHSVGSFYSTGRHFDGYLAEVHFVDGTALAPTDFGEYDDNNNWNPKDTSGLTFGTNGFHLDFSDNSSNAALGTDSSGNSNTWTVNNLVAVAGLETANQGFDVVTYTGNGSTQSITGLNFQPDFIWFKRRNSVSNHALYDVIRGATKVLGSDSTSAEVTETGGFDSFDANGFSLDGFNSTFGSTNANGGTFVAWCWKAGGTASSNSDGSITSSVSVNTTYGFSIVAFDTGSSSSNETVGHGLGATPKLVIVKDRDAVDHWFTWSDTFSNSTDQYLRLDGNQAIATSTGVWGAGMTSSVIGLAANQIGGNNIAYCWSEISGFSKFGSFSGTGSSGNKVTTGFKPAYLLIKNTAAGSWFIFDKARNPSDPRNSYLVAHDTNAEDANNTSVNINFDFDGFTINGTSSGINGSGSTYIYAAFAGTPPGEVIDSLIDTPTNYTAASGNNGGNYATLNVLSTTNTGGLANGNLEHSGLTNSHATIRIPSTGKWYFEFTPTQKTAGYVMGIQALATPATPSNSNTMGVDEGGNRYNGNGSTTSSFLSAIGVGDTLGVAIDQDGDTINFYRNGVAGGSTLTPSSLGSDVVPFIHTNSATVHVNFGQRPFAYTPPTGYASLCTANLTDPTIADGSTVFDTKLYTGNGSSQTISGLGFNPDLVWLKVRSGSGDHGLWDVVRGTTKRLVPNGTNTESTASGVTAFNSDGFSLGAAYNVNSDTYVGWVWDAGTSTATNNDGSIAASVRVNQSAGFSIVSWTGSGSGSTTVGHGLNAAPYMFIVKDRSNARNWLVYHTGMGATRGMQLNLTTAQSGADAGYWNNTDPTSTTISLGTYANESANYIAYCWAPVAGYSSFGQYTGNGSSDGTFVYLGFRPKFLLWKNTSAVANWYIYDSARSTYNVVNLNLEPNTSDAERTLTSMNVDFLSNGYKIRGSDGDINGSGSTYIYAAFAEHPFKTARAR